MDKFEKVRTFFESCADKLVRDLFETLLAVKSFNPDLMGFLIEVQFWKGYKIGTMLSKIKKSAKNDIFVFLRSSLSHKTREVCKYVLKQLTGF